MHNVRRFLYDNKIFHYRIDLPYRLVLIYQCDIEILNFYGFESQIIEFDDRL